jgi:hypothetical protein
MKNSRLEELRAKDREHMKRLEAEINNLNKFIVKQ